MKLWVFAGFVFILLPIALIIWLSFFTDPLLSLPPTGFSVQWYWHIFGQPQFLNGFVLSLKVALIAMATGLLVSIPASLILTRTRFRGQTAILKLLTAPLIGPSTVIGDGLYIAFIRSKGRRVGKEGLLTCR